MTIEELQDAIEYLMLPDHQSLKADVLPYIDVVVEAARLVADLRAIVDEQAKDEGLWFVALTATEAYLQQELRRLHAVIELGVAPPGDPMIADNVAAALTPGDTDEDPFVVTSADGSKTYFRDCTTPQGDD